MSREIYQLRWGWFSLIDGDLVSEFAKKFGEWSEVELSVFKDVLLPTDNIIEVGSNLGLHTVALAKIAHQGKVISFEPQRIIFQKLCTNIMVNDLKNVYSYQQGVADKDKVIEIESSNYQTAWNYGSFSLDKGYSTEYAYQENVIKEPLQQVTLDNHPTVAWLEQLKLLKIDAEGFDIKVLKGAKKTIAKHKPIIFVEVHAHSWQTLYTQLKKMDYECYWLVSRRFQENNFFNKTQNDINYPYEGAVDMNFICFHKDNLGQHIPPYLTKVEDIKDGGSFNIPLLANKK